ncbi:DUF3501 family protein [Caldiplasma sukawensis]
MRKITQGEVLSPEEYDKIKNEERNKIIKLKKMRRVSSKTFSYLFENRETVLNQMNEMIYIENIHDPDEIEHIVSTYNDLIPSENEFSVSMFIEISDQNLLVREMPVLVGIENSVYLIFDGTEIKADPEEGRSTDTLESTLQYLRFKIPKEEKDKFLNAKTAFITTRHSKYRESAEISEELLNVLKKEISH